MISLYDLLEASNGQLFGEAAAQLFASFSIDVHHVEESSLFVAMKGDFGDTHLDMEEAVQNGATGLLCSSPPTFDTESVTVIVVQDTEKALIDWTRFILDRLPARHIAVAGTSGRTTTIKAIEAALGKDYTVHTHTDEYHIGRLSLPLALASLERKHDFTVLEMMTDNPGEIAQLVDMLQPEVVVVTNVGRAYLDRFKSVEQIAEDIEFAVKSVPNNGVAILNYNDDAVRAMQAHTSARVMTVGVGSNSFGADMMAYNIVPGPSRTGFDIRFNNQRYVGNWVPLCGELQLYSALFALAVAAHYNVPIERALRRLTEMPTLAGRMNTLVGENGCLIVDDTFDATPESVKDALVWLAEIKDDNTRSVFILGDIDHLGDSSRLIHRQLGQQAIEVADIVVTEGALAALAGRAAQDVATSEQQVHVAYSIKDAVSALKMIGNITEHDVFLVTGGAGAQMEAVVKALLPDETDHDQLTRQRTSGNMPIQSGRPLQPSWVEVDLELLSHNVRTIKTYIGDDVTLMATVKADAYGHGAVAVSRVALQNGANYLAVASVREALELRDAGIDAPVLVLSYTPTYAIREAIRHNLAITVYDLDLARAYNKVAKEVGGHLRIHVKVDTGMGRLGVLPEQAVELFRYLLTMQHLEIEGIYTHFSVANENREFTEEQVKVLKSVLIPLRAGGIKFKYVHVSNTAGMLLDKDFHFDMVRAGIALYGYPETKLDNPLSQLKPILTWKTVIAQVKTLPEGHHVGYGNAYTTDEPERVAVIPVGYGDGLRRAPNNWGRVLVNGEFAPIRGVVSMEKTVISVDHIPGVSIGDEVVLLGKQGDNEITAHDVAEQLETNTYEVLTSVLPRVSRH